MISISNIAWDTSLDEEVAKLLNDCEVSYIDIAPPKYFNSPHNVTDVEVLKVRDYWLERRIKPIGMQALLFGTEGLNVFGSNAVQIELLNHLSHICRIGRLLGAKKLVFGSPKNRDRSSLNDSDTMAIAVDFFNQLGDRAKNEGVVVCLEPNPVCYQSNFMTNSMETARVVEAINHPNIRMQLDVGAMVINQEQPLEVLRDIKHLIHHIHISEPQLLPLNKNNTIHSLVSEAIRDYLPQLPLTIEMLTTNHSSTLSEIEDSIQIVKNIYRCNL